MADTFQLDIITPERTVFSGKATGFVAPGVLGEFGVLPGHANMLAELRNGEIRYKSQGSEQILASGGGFAEVTGEKVTVLLDRALYPEEIDIEEMRVALERAEEKHYGPQDEPYADWQNAIQWIEACLRVAGSQGKTIL
jgi:F-type H+-transporting ATPase subunit epsilon